MSTLQSTESAVEVSPDRALIFALGAFYPELDDGCTQAAELAQERGASSVSELRECALIAFGELDYGVTSQPAQASESCAETLAQWWGIESRADAVDMVQALLAGMHQPQFASEASADVTADEELAPVRAFALAYAEDLGPTGILAWDLARAVHVTRLAVAARLLSEAEGWALLSPLPTIARASFSTWSDYATSYLAGFAYWRLSNGPLDDDDEELSDLQENAAQLLEHPLSIWQFVSL